MTNICLQVKAAIWASGEASRLACTLTSHANRPGAIARLGAGPAVTSVRLEIEAAIRAGINAVIICDRAETALHTMTATTGANAKTRVSMVSLNWVEASETNTAGTAHKQTPHAMAFPS